MTEAEALMKIAEAILELAKVIKSVGFDLFILGFLFLLFKNMGGK